MNESVLMLAATALVIGYIVLWIWAMVNAAKNGKWVWAILVFLWSPITLALYLLFSYEREKPPSGGQPTLP